jgi:transposase
LFQKLEAKHPDAKVIHPIVDNATYYKSKPVKEYLKTSKIVIHFLPGDSPNLNLIERLWKFFKKKILYNKYYETFDEFLLACKNFFRCRTSTGTNCARYSPKNSINTRQVEPNFQT